MWFSAILASFEPRRNCSRSRAIVSGAGAGARDTENVFKLYLEKLTALKVKPLRVLLLMVRGMLRAGHAPGWPQGKSILQEARCPPPHGANTAKMGKKKAVNGCSCYSAKMLS